MKKSGGMVAKLLSRGEEFLSAKFIQAVYCSTGFLRGDFEPASICSGFGGKANGHLAGMEQAESFAGAGNYSAMKDDVINEPGESSKAAPASAINVWLVDDNKNLRGALKELLARCEGVRCEAEFHSPNAVLSALASRPGPDAILLDIQMGEANGLDAIRPIKALSRGTQVVMFTTCFDSESKKRALKNGASDFLLKTTPAEKIVDSLQRAAENPAPHLKRSLSRPQPGSVVLKSSSSPRPHRRLLWLEQYLDLIPVRRRKRFQTPA